MNNASNKEIVAKWDVPMSKNVYHIEFYHGTTTGKRIIRINGKEILRRNWMFRLVGREFFELNGVRCTISIEAIGVFAYEYSLKVGGKVYEKFREQQQLALEVWRVPIASANDNDSEVRVCLERNTMEVWVNGSKVNTTGEFMDSGGTRTHFEIYSNEEDMRRSQTDDDAPPISSSGIACFIETENSGKRSIGVIHKLFVNGKYFEPIKNSNENLEKN